MNNILIGEREGMIRIGNAIFEKGEIQAMETQKSQTYDDGKTTSIPSDKWVIDVTLKNGVKVQAGSFCSKEDALSHLAVAEKELDDDSGKKKFKDVDEAIESISELLAERVNKQLLELEDKDLKTYPKNIKLEILKQTLKKLHVEDIYYDPKKKPVTADSIVDVYEFKEGEKTVLSMEYVLGMLEVLLNNQKAKKNVEFISIQTPDRSGNKPNWFDWKEVAEIKNLFVEYNLKDKAM